MKDIKRLRPHFKKFMDIPLASIIPKNVYHTQIRRNFFKNLNFSLKHENEPKCNFSVLKITPTNSNLKLTTQTNQVPL